MSKQTDRVRQWRINNPEKYKEQKKLELERRKLKRQGVEVVYEDRIPWNKGITQSTDSEKRVNRLITRARERAMEKNIGFNITCGDIDIPTHCPYLGIELDYNGLRCDGSVSLDRIIPELGYVVGNVQIISMLANQMKSSASIEQLVVFSESIKRIYC